MTRVEGAVKMDRLRVGRRTLGIAAVFVSLLYGCSPANASQRIDSFFVLTSTSQAGGHPDLETQFTLDSPGEPEAAKNISVNLPTGVFGNPNAVPRCSSVDFALDQCPSFSQVGKITITANHDGEENNLLGTAPVFTVEPRATEETARLAFIVPGLDIPISIPVAVRTTTDYGLRMTVTGITQEVPLRSADITIWGFPADPSHNDERFAKGSPGDPAVCIGSVVATCTGSHSAAVADRPFTDNPTVCTGEPLTVSLEVQTYQDPETASRSEASYPATTECEEETFNPVLELNLTDPEADSPSGLDMQLKAPQFEGFANSPSEIKFVSVTLPEGLSINPDAADGQTACTDAQADFGSEGPSHCPDNSKIGNFEIDTPALDGPLLGSLYFGEPTPTSQYRVFMMAEGFGIYAKLKADVHPNPTTGQLMITVQELPQTPFEAFNLHLFASDRGLVATPTACTVYNADSLFTPWNTALAPQHSGSHFSVVSGPGGKQCPGQLRPFHPRLVAGMSNSLAGAFSNFHLKLDRDDGDQYLAALKFTMPPGFTGSLRGITYCPEAKIAEAAGLLGRTEQEDPSCPASSHIGTTNVSAGPGDHPFNAVGNMYLAGPFEGAPLSLVTITPALAGPFDYGTVVVRVALSIDTTTAQVRAASGAIPSIIGGVPIRMRTIQVNIDRPNFTINPTNCSPFSIESQGIGDQGTVSGFSSYFHAVNCATLGFRPRMKITQLGGPGATGRSKDPSLRFDLTTRPGDANIKSLSVTLPKAFEIDQRHLGNICSRVQLASEHCAGRQAIGTATTETPLLEAPLKGPAYAVSGFGKLPHVAFILGGQVTIIPEAESSSVAGGRLKTIVPVVPDAPIGHFRLTLFGGKRGYIVNTRDLCSAPAATAVEYTGQNGKSRKEVVKTQTACGGESMHRRHRRTRR